MSTQTKLWYIESYEDGNEYDAFIVAYTAEEATKLWREYYKEEEYVRETDPDLIIEVPVHELLNRTPHYVDWNNVWKR